jgi:hypothetical protein
MTGTHTSDGSLDPSHFTCSQARAHSDRLQCLQKRVVPVVQVLYTALAFCHLPIPRFNRSPAMVETVFYFVTLCLFVSLKVHADAALVHRSQAVPPTVNPEHRERRARQRSQA